MDEIQANVSYLENFRDACIMAFTETWLTALDLDTDLTLTSFETRVRLDRNVDFTRKSQRGGVCLFVSQQWCKNITVTETETVCIKDIEQLSVSVHPFSIPFSFPQIFITIVYIHLRANAKMQSLLFRKSHRNYSLSRLMHLVSALAIFNHCKFLSVYILPNQNEQNY